MVSSTEGSSTRTFWKRRSSAASFSMYLRYSSSVVAPMQCSSPRASAGLSMLPASMAPSALPAPTIVCISSMNRTMRPSSWATSFSTDLSRSSNSPRYLAPASNAAMSSTSTRLSFRVSGTSPLMMRCARPSTIAVLPTPGSPISTGLFLVRRCRIWIVRRISSSRPITGSSLPWRARSVRSRVYFARASRWPSASWFDTLWPPRIDSIARSRCSRVAPCCLNSRPASPLSSSRASRNSSEAMNWSPRFCASLSVRFSRFDSSRETLTSPPCPSTLGRRPIAALSASRSGPTLTPAFASSELVPPSSCSIRASSRWTGSMYGLSLPIARLWASAKACWNLVVNLSKRIGPPRRLNLVGRCGLPPRFQWPLGCAQPGGMAQSRRRSRRPAGPASGARPEG